MNKYPLTKKMAKTMQKNNIYRLKPLRNTGVLQFQYSGGGKFQYLVGQITKFNR